METPVPIDISTWPRREYFEHYLNKAPCTYAMTVELDATAFADTMRQTNRKTYLAQIWAIASIVNQHDEFRTCLDSEGRPAIWPVMHPAFTVFNAECETFASVWAPYDPDFHTFHDRALEVLARYRTATTLFPQEDRPDNAFDISSLPWASFTGFTLNIRDSWNHLAPIFTLGRYTERDGLTRLPLAVQLHHAVADGYHATRLTNELQHLLADPTWVG